MEDKYKQTLEELEARRQQVEALLPYRYFKLNNGEDIIGQLVMSVEIENTYLVRYPFRIVTAENDPDHSLFALVPMIPFTHQEIVPVGKSSVIAITSLRDEIKEIYIERVAEHISEMAESGVSAFAPADEEPDENGDDDDDFEHVANKRHEWIN